MAYDSGIISFTTKTNKVDLVDAAHINAVQAELVTIETILGTGVKGTASSLSARLNKALDADGTILSGSSFPSPGLTSQAFYYTVDNKLYLFNGLAWVPPSAGIDLSSSTTVTAASNSGDIAITAIDFYEIKGVLRGFSADDSLAIRFNNDTGTTYSTITRGFEFDATPTAANSVATGATSGFLGPVDAAAAAEHVVFSIRIYPQRNDSQTVSYKGEIEGQNSSAVQYFRDVAGVWSGAGAAVTSFRILTTGGATMSGNIYLYKYARS